MMTYHKQINGNKYMPMWNFTMRKLCTFLKTDTNFYDQIVQKTDLPTRDSFECPPGIPPGHYNFNNYNIFQEGILPDYIPGSEFWRFNFRYKRNNRIIGGVDTFVVIRKKKNFKKLP